MRRICLIIAIALAASPLAAGPARAAGVGGPNPFGLTPVPATNGQPRPYFQLQLSAGQSASDDLIISNDGKATLHLIISSSAGTTSPNSGTAFQGYFQPCGGVSCWLTGLPAQVTLPPGGRDEAGFKVRVPAGTSPQQYLAGITAQPAGPPSSVPVGSNGQASANVLVIDQVSVGVAITVGAPDQLRTAVDIPDVTAGRVGPTPRLYVQVHNDGQTFAHATGSAVCTLPTRRLTIPITMNTVLPGDAASLPVNAPGLPVGVPTSCTIQLLYGSEQLADWSGAITIPALHQAAVVPTGPGAFSAVPSDHGLPTWAIILIAVAALAVVLLAVAIFLLLRKQAKPDPTTPNQ